jgi:RNA polymerase sigma factor for flagellar operon FliA
MDIGGLELAIFPSDREDGPDESTVEQIPDAETTSPLAYSIASQQRDVLLRAIDELPANERQVLALYYYEELTMKEVGAVLGVGESRISQIHSMALVRLRARLQQVAREKSPLRKCANA